MCICIEESVLKYRCCGSYNIVITFTKLMSLTQTSLHIFSLKRKKKYKVFRDYVQIFFYDIMDCIRKLWNCVELQSWPKDIGIHCNSVLFPPFPLPLNNVEILCRSVDGEKCTWNAEVCAQTINVWRISKRSNVLLRRQF